jgi:Rap guanine nucleotide exchange factor 1
MHALKHFKDVISKNKLEMLHGNGTIVLETVTNVLTGQLQKCIKLNVNKVLNIFKLFSSIKIL